MDGIDAGAKLRKHVMRLVERPWCDFEDVKAFTQERRMNKFNLTGSTFILSAVRLYAVLMILPTKFFAWTQLISVAVMRVVEIIGNTLQPHIYIGGAMNNRAIACLRTQSNIG